LKHTDDYIKDIFSQRLGEYESAVRPELWSNIASQLPASSAATGGGASAGASASVATKVISTKLIWAAAVAAITAVTAVTYVAVQKEEVASSAPTTVIEPAPTTEQSTPATSENTTPVSAETEASAPVINTDKQQITLAAVAKGSQSATAAQTQHNSPSVPAQQDVATHNSATPSTSVTPAQDVVIATPSPSTQPSTSAVQSVPVKEEKLTAQFNTARVSKDELQFFFMPQHTTGESYHWDFGDGTSVTDLSPMHRFEEEGIHQVVLTVTDAQGKQEQHTFDVAAYLPAEMNVPNIFTPNGDGLNDTFDVLEKSRNITLKKTVVFSNDRIVFETDDERLWDGNDQQGNPLPQGEYKFFITAIDKEGNKVEKKGFVTLRR
jgi:gliding motility-associated-like protein